MRKYNNKLVKEYNKEDLEILISTMDRNSLDFLIPMFPFCHFSKFSILIINQTQENNILTSEFPNVRVINSFEKGLSKSRNLAIQNTIKEICIIADDDIIYFPNFENDIIATFNKLQNAEIITFNHQRIGFNKPRNSSQIVYEHTKKSIWNVISFEIAFKTDVIKSKKIYYDENFGLGSFFETAEEFLFLKMALELKIKTYFNPLVIVSHPLLCSGDYQGEDKLVYARSALFCKLRGNMVYLWLIKYLFFIVRNNYIKWNECNAKFRIGLSGIKKYKELENLK